jgi:phosphoribosyl-ATP pyrophosphohydrolase
VARTIKKRPEESLVHDRIVELETAVAGVRDGRKTSPRTARLLAAGLPRIAQKLAEEATEVVIEAVRGERSAVLNESVDLLYNLVVLWSEIGIAASEVWAEMDRRQALLGMGRSCRRKTWWARRPPPGTSEEGGRMLRDALGVSISVERFG